MENRKTLGSSLADNMNKGKTWNGADTFISTGEYCLDLFGRGGALRNAEQFELNRLISKAYADDKDLAMKILFYIRDIRGGYGERDTFQTMARWIADRHTSSIVKNLWAFVEFGRAKDLYCLIGTKAERAMWEFMSKQFEDDYKNMEQGKSISLLAKWIATPDASSAKTSALGKLTAKKLGYNYKTMSAYKKKLRALRKYLDITERKMCSNDWQDINYSAVPSQCMRKNSMAFEKHDTERFTEFIKQVNAGTVKMNTSTLTPVDIIKSLSVENEQSRNELLETMWNNLEDFNKGNVMVMCDTSGSMSWGYESKEKPILVALALTLYIAERNKGDLKNMFMTFSSEPEIQRIVGTTLVEKMENLSNAYWEGSTNLESAFMKILDICLQDNISKEDMPKAFVVVSDMQIDQADRENADENGTLMFYDSMKKKYEDAGYEMPHIIFWNVNAESPSFLVAHSTKATSLVSGYSTNIFKQVLESIGSTPYELMLKVINSERYSKIEA